MTRRQERAGGIDPRVPVFSLLIGLGLILPAWANASGSTAEPVALLPYAPLYEAIGPLQDPAFDRLFLRFQIGPQAEGAPVTPPLKAWVERNGQREDLTIHADNVVDIPYRSDWAAEEVGIAFNQPRGSLSLSAGIAIRVEGTEIPYRDLEAAFTQFDAFVQDRAGLAALLAPRADAALIDCGSGCTATVRQAGTEQIHHPGEDGRIAIERDRSRDSAETTIHLSAPLRYALVRTDE